MKTPIIDETARNILNILRKHINKIEVRLTDSPIMNQLSYEISADRFANAGFVIRGDLERGIADTVEYLKGVAEC